LGFVEAFTALGYQIKAPRQDWSASTDTGVCITLWRVELESAGIDGCWLNTKLHCKPINVWRNKPGNRKRIRHLRQAIDHFDRFVDVIINDGIPGVGYKNANPWFPNERGLRWRIVDFDESTGHFEVKAEAICEN
jgi:hypothetical protein